MRRLSSLRAVGAALLALAAFPTSLAAQSLHDAPPGDGPRAIEKGGEGVTLYEQGKWNEALERFRQAESLYHSPVFVLYAARSLRNSGRLLEAREDFRRLASERLELSAPELWKQAQREGIAELTALEGNIPSVVIGVDGASQATEVTVDDRSVVPGRLLELDPGPHQLFVTDGTRRKSLAFRLVPGAREQSILVKFPASAAPSPQSAAGTRRATRRDPPGENGGLYVPGLIVSGVGGVALVAGGVVGILALDQKSDLETSLPSSCQQMTCPRSKRAEIEDGADKVRGLATAADVLLIGGAAVAGVGVGLLLFGPSHEPAVAVRVSSRGADLRVKF